MQMTTEQLPDGVERIALTGRLDTAGAQEVDEQFALLAAGRPDRIVVDLSQVSFLASAGLRTLVSCAKSLAKAGGRMVLAGPQPMVQEVLRLASIHALIPVHSDVASACATLAGPSGSTAPAGAGSR